MADPRLLPSSIQDERNKHLARLMDGPGTLDLVPLLVHHFDTVPSSALPHLIEHYALEEFTSDTLPEEAVRRLLSRAILLHRFKGTRFAVEQALDAAGIRAEITEWFEDGGSGQPYTFRVTAFVQENIDPDGQSLLDAATLERAFRLINASKRASVTYDLTLAVDFSDGLKLGSAASAHVNQAACGTASTAVRDHAIGIKAGAVLDTHVNQAACSSASPRENDHLGRMAVIGPLSTSTLVFASFESIAP